MIPVGPVVRWPLAYAAVERTFGGVVDRYMLDWLFNKQARRSVECAFRATMNELNKVGGSRISDHPPLTVDLLLDLKR
jgi:hypothetical protein